MPNLPTIENSKSFATEANLTKALRKLGFDQYRYLVVLNRQHRFTAVFPLSSVPNGAMTIFAREGFYTLG